MASLDSTFEIELRTIDPTKRRNYWWEPNDRDKKLTLNFTKEVSAKYSVVEGDKPGRYVFSVSSTLAFNESNIITVNIDNRIVETGNPKWTVTPYCFTPEGKIDPALITNTWTLHPQNTNKIETLGQNNADEDYPLLMQVNDQFGNKCPITETNVDNMLLTNLTDPTEAKIGLKPKVTPDSLIQLTFNPVLAGKYSFKFNSNERTFNIVPGVPSGKTSFSDMKYETEAKEMEAGKLFKFEITAVDSDNNVIECNSTVMVNFKAYVKLESDKFWKNIENPVCTEDKSGFIYSANLTKTGNYDFYASLNDVEIQCTNCELYVYGGPLNFAASILEYYDDKGSVYNTFEQTYRLKEDKTLQPLYRLLMVDIYDNPMDRVPEDFNISGVMIDDSTEEKVTIASNSLTFNWRQLKGTGYVYFALSADGADYWNSNNVNAGLANLEITFKSITRTWLISIIGPEEDATSDVAEFEGKNTKFVVRKPGSQSVEYSTTLKLSTVAGVSIDVLIELRSKTNLRKKNIEQELSAYFNPTHKASKIDSIARADLQGRYVVSLYVEKSYTETNPLLITFKQAGIELPLSVELVVSPAELETLNITSPIVNGSADIDYSFIVTPWDKFGNNPSVSIDEVNVKIDPPAPEDLQLGQEQTEVELLTVSYTAELRNDYSILYTMANRKAGIYRVDSKLFNKDYEITIIPGKPFPDSTSIEIKNNRIIAGEEIGVYLYARDKQNNVITAEFMSINDYSVYYDINGNTKGRLTKWFDAPPSDERPNRIKTLLNVTKAGTTYFKSYLNIEGKDVPITCTKCEVTVVVGDLFVSNTEFIQVRNDETFATQNLQINRLELIEVTLRFNDRYWNNIPTYNTSQNFSATIFGNNMEELGLNMTRTDSSAILGVLQDDQSFFRRLVPAKNYIIQIDYQLYVDDTLKWQTKGRSILTMEILGDAKGYGNGILVPEATQINPTDITKVAGDLQTTIRIELRQSENKKYAGFFYDDEIKVEEKLKDNETEFLNVTLFKGEADSIYYANVYGEKATYDVDREIIVSVKKNNKWTSVATVIYVKIFPDFPDWNKTEIVKPFNETVRTEEITSVLFRLYDKYSNVYIDQNIAGKIEGKITSQNEGSEVTSISKADKWTYQINVKPVYPPKEFEMLIYYRIDEQTKVSIILNPLKTIVTTYIDAERTLLQGEKLKGITADEILDFFVLIRDTGGFCYEGDANISAVISGPFLTNDIGDSRLYPSSKNLTVVNATIKIKDFKEGQQEVTNKNSQCLKYYYASLNDGDIKKIGFYQIDIYIQGDGIKWNEENKAFASTRQVRMIPGRIVPQNSAIVMPDRKGLGSGTLNLVAGEYLGFEIWTYDRFDNKFDYPQWDGEVSILEMKNLNKTVDWMSIETKTTNGQYNVQLMIGKVDTYSEFSISIKDTQVEWNKLKKIDAPEVISVIPGKCVTLKYNVAEKITCSSCLINIGERNEFGISCNDVFSNEVVTGGSKISVIITGKNLDKVGSDTVLVNIVDENNGKYTVDFTVAWSGNYDLYILNDGNPESSIFSFNATLQCTSDDKPLKCPNVDLCAASYAECGIVPDEVNTTINCDVDIEIACKVDKVEKCARTPTDCDKLEVGYKKCVSTGIWMLETDYPFFCQTSSVNCDTNYPVQCRDGSCRKAQSECPSSFACPPNQFICPDTTCVNTGEICPPPKTDCKTTPTTPYLC